MLFSKTHEWVNIEGDIATTGITSFAVEQLSDLVYINLPDAGQSFKKGNTIGEVESVKAVSDLYIPLSGEIAEINENASSNLDIITKNPQGEGWLIKIKVSNPEELKELMSQDEYNKLYESENN